MNNKNTIKLKLIRSLFARAEIDEIIINTGWFDRWSTTYMYKFIIWNSVRVSSIPAANDAIYSEYVCFIKYVAIATSNKFWPKLHLIRDCVPTKQNRTNKQTNKIFKWIKNKNENRNRFEYSFILSSHSILIEPLIFAQTFTMNGPNTRVMPIWEMTLCKWMHIETNM